MADDRTPNDSDTVATVAVISNQIGQLQKSIDDGLLRLDRRMDDQGARIRALEEFRIRQETREEERRRGRSEGRETGEFLLSRRQAILGGLLGIAMLVLGILNYIAPG